ncbi:MAG: V-type ATPase subunit [Brevinemataceae bacterium]
MESWGYLSGLLRSERANLLTDNQFGTFAEAADTDSLVKLLEDTVYGSMFHEKTLKEFAPVLGSYYKNKMEQIKEMAPCPIILSVHKMRYDLNNLKLCYKAKLTHTEVNWSHLSEEGTIAPEKMFSIIENELFNELPQPVAQALIMFQQNHTTHDIRFADFLIDSAYYGYRLQVLKKAAENEPGYYRPIFEFYQKEVDCENIKNFLRAKNIGLEKDYITHLMIPGGMISELFFADYANISVDDVPDLIRETWYGDLFMPGINEWISKKSCSLLEKQIDEFLIDLVKEFSYINEGPAVAEEALRSVSMELKNLKLIIIGKLNNMSSEEIKGRIRNVGN